MRPCASPFGISWWRMPLPAVIHCTSPAPSAAAIAEAVAVLDRAGQHVGDRLDAAVRMPGKPRQVVVGVVVAEIVEQQERIEVRRVAEPERALQLDARPLHRCLTANQFHDRPYLTCWSLLPIL